MKIKSWLQLLTVFLILLVVIVALPYFLITRSGHGMIQESELVEIQVVVRSIGERPRTRKEPKRTIFHLENTPYSLIVPSHYFNEDRHAVWSGDTIWVSLDQGAVNRAIESSRIKYIDCYGVRTKDKTVFTYIDHNQKSKRQTKIFVWVGLLAVLVYTSGVGWHYRKEIF